MTLVVMTGVKMLTAMPTALLQIHFCTDMLIDHLTVEMRVGLSVCDGSVRSCVLKVGALQLALDLVLVACQPTSWTLASFQASSPLIIIRASFGRLWPMLAFLGSVEAVLFPAAALGC